MNDIPEINSLWVHNRSGNTYEVYDITNRDSTREGFPIMVSYRRLRDDSRWSRNLSDWHRSFTQTAVT
jgi:hypothetical protein